MSRSIGKSETIDLSTDIPQRDIIPAASRYWRPSKSNISRRCTCFALVSPSRPSRGGPRILSRLPCIVLLFFEEFDNLKLFVHPILHFDDNQLYSSDTFTGTSALYARQNDTELGAHIFRWWWAWGQSHWQPRTSVRAAYNNEWSESSHNDGYTGHFFFLTEIPDDELVSTRCVCQSQKLSRQLKTIGCGGGCGWGRPRPSLQRNQSDLGQVTGPIRFVFSCNF